MHGPNLSSSPPITLLTSITDCVLRILCHSSPFPKPAIFSKPLSYFIQNESGDWTGQHKFIQHLLKKCLLY